MLTVGPTELLTGARISGDYWDIDELLTAIYQVTGDENRYYDFQGARNRILGVCLELRHAMIGERNVEFITNGIHKGVEIEKKIIAPQKNVYFSAEVLLPELIFTAIALNDFIRLHQEMIDDSDWNIHIAVIRRFQAIIADSLKELMEDEHYSVFVQMLRSRKPAYFRYATQYVDVLNLEYLALSKEERESNIAAFAIRLLIEDENYEALKDQLLSAAKVTKNSLHELDITIKYPETIEW